VLVSNRCGCTPDLVREGRNGHTFDPYDVNGLAELFGRIAIDSRLCRELGIASENTIDEWGLERFAEGLSHAASAARAAPPARTNVVDRLLLSR
jgi:hypothetical protein